MLSDYHFNFEGLRVVDGCGKFGGELVLSEIFYLEHDFSEETSLDGWGSYGLMRFPRRGRWTYGWPKSWCLKNGITRGEMDFLKSQAGVIIHERDDGGMQIAYYDLAEASVMEDEWHGIEKDIEEAARFYCGVEECPGHYRDSCDEQECEPPLSCDEPSCYNSVNEDDGEHRISDITFGLYCSQECMEKDEVQYELRNS